MLIFDITTPNEEYTNRIGGSWKAPVNVNNPSLTVGRPDITINEDNIAEIAHDDSGISAFVGDLNNATSFTSQAIDATVPLTDSNVSIAIDNSGNTWIAYQDETGADDYITLVKHNDADAWTTWQTPVNNSNVGKMSSIATSGSKRLSLL